MGVPSKQIQVCTVCDPNTQVHLSRTVLYSIQYMITTWDLSSPFTSPAIYKRSPGPAHSLHLNPLLPHWAEDLACR